MNTDQKKTDDQSERCAETIADLPVNNPNEESITGGALSDNQRGTHVAGTIAAIGNNGVGY